MDLGISIIIPYYNSKEYIIQCLNSIRNSIRKSHYDNYEIILVDDCSTDESSEIAKRFLEENQMFYMMIRNENNQGPGCSRNSGIAIATKDYITFVDSDDEVSTNFFSCILYALRKNNLDCVVFNAWQENGHKLNRLNAFFGGRFEEGMIERKNAVVFIRGATWGKVYKTSIIKNNHVQFADILRGEDIVFTKIAISYCVKIVYLADNLYLYHDNINSLMHNANLLDQNNAIHAYKIIEQSFSERDLEEELQSIYMLQILYSVTLTKILKNSSTFEIKEYYKKNEKKYNYNNEYHSEYPWKYKIAIFLFRLRLFRMTKLLLRIIKH